VPRNKPAEFAGDPNARDRSVGDERQALAAAVVDHNQDAHAAAVDELVGYEVERPTFVGRLWGRGPQSPLASAAPAHHQAFLAYSRTAVCGSP
jgi:hypothetical protein